MTRLILEHDIIARLVLLDHAVFQQQSLPFGIDDCGLDIPDFGNHHPHFPVVVLFVEVRRYAIFEFLGLAYVDNGSFVVVKTINSRLVRQALQNQRYLLTTFHFSRLQVTGVRLQFFPVPCNLKPDP